MHRTLPVWHHSSIHPFDLQVACHRFYPKSVVKNWNSKFITVSGSRLACGSTREKTLSRAFGHGVADGDFDKSIPLEGCIPRAVAEHAGRKHVMAVAFPNFSFLPEEVFAFEDPAKRDACMQRLQVRACKAVRAFLLDWKQGTFIALRIVERALF